MQTLSESSNTMTEERLETVCKSLAPPVGSECKNGIAHSNLKKVPLYLVTGSQDENRPPTYRALGVFSLLKFPVRLTDLENVPHQYRSPITELVWQFFVQKTSK